MKSIGSLLHSVVFHTRVITSRQMTSSGALTPEKIESLRKKMASLAEESNASRNPSILPPISDEDLIKQAAKEDDELIKQAAREKFAREVFEAIKKKET